MTSIFSQIITVMIMNIRSLPHRFWMSFSAILAISVVVAVLLSFLSMSNGFKKTLEGAGSEETAIITRSGSRSELNSNMSNDIVNIITEAPGIAKNASGKPIFSPELFVIVDGIRRTTNGKANLPMRGISTVGFDLRSNIKIVEGRIFEPGKNEIIVGKTVVREFAGFDLGTQVRFGKTEWTIVGVFTTGGSAFESELWADTRTVQSQFRRGNSFQTIRVLLETPGDVQGMLDLVEQDPRLSLDIETEADFFKEQSRAVGGLVTMGWTLSLIMSLGALSGALNTMYTSVSDREQEIATLRAIGFSNISAFFGTLVESIVLSIFGGVLGATASYLFMNGRTSATMGGNFTQVGFTFDMSPELFINGIVLALIIGLVGGIFPAWRAARLPVVLAFRGGV